MPNLRLMATFAVAVSSFAMMGLAAGEQGSLKLCFMAFLIFEFCCGLYFPTIGVLKSEVVPEHVRTTMYNFYRIPLNAVVVGLLLSNISMIRCFTLCAALLMASLFAVLSIWAAPRTKEEAP